MCRYPNAENRNIDRGDDDNSAPFDIAYSLAVLSDQSNAIDDDLHEQLYLEDPEEENEEEDLNTADLVQYTQFVWRNSSLRWSQLSIEKQPSHDSDRYIHEDLTPYHVDIRRP